MALQRPDRGSTAGMAVCPEIGQAGTCTSLLFSVELRGVELADGDTIMLNPEGELNNIYSEHRDRTLEAEDANGVIPLEVQGDPVAHVLRATVGRTTSGNIRFTFNAEPGRLPAPRLSIKAALLTDAGGVIDTGEDIVPTFLPDRKHTDFDLELVWHFADGERFSAVDSIGGAPNNPGIQTLKSGPLDSFSSLVFAAGKHLQIWPEDASDRDFRMCWMDERPDERPNNLPDKVRAQAEPLRQFHAAIARFCGESIETQAPHTIFVRRAPPGFGTELARYPGCSVLTVGQDDVGLTIVDEDDSGPKNVEQDEGGLDDVDDDGVAPKNVQQLNNSLENVEPDDVGPKSSGQEDGRLKDVAPNEVFHRLARSMVRDRVFLDASIDEDGTENEPLWFNEGTRRRMCCD